jgi:diadenylate cyclase
MLELFKIGFINFTFFDLLDIVIVSVIFYYIYKSLKHTIAMQILIGLVILIALTSITETINLNTTNWIFNKITDVWLVAFIVLFHPEIRKMLLLFTRNNIFHRFVKRELLEKIDDIIDAVSIMSNEHTGALIIFPKTQNVHMTIESGLELQSVISKEMILSIFNHRSPMHDGAIIIDNNLITHAKCFSLTLSSQQRYGAKILGSRHRAALGWSEQIDAVILIVSEETGAISLAVGGELIFDIPKENLKEILRQKIESNNIES